MSAPLRFRPQQFGRLLPRFDLTSGTWLRWVRSGLAPKPVKLGPGVTAWKVADLRNWLSQSEAV